MKKENLRGIIIGLAVGDALGVPVEFEYRKNLAENPVKGMKNFGTWNQPAGTWSDDTSLTIAAAESIFRRKKIDFEDIMENFLRWYEKNEFTATGERFDIGNTTRSAIKRYSRRLLPPIKCGSTDENSNGNGSLMRILPATAYLFYKNGKISGEELKIIHEFSALTHGHMISCMACGIYSLIAAELLSGKNIFESFSIGMENAKKFYGANETFKKFSRICDKNFAALPENSISSSGYVVDTLEAAFWCLLNTENFQSLALKAVNLGGDTDTTAAVACGLGGIYYKVESIPEEWLNILKRRDYLEKIAENLAEAL